MHHSFASVDWDNSHWNEGEDGPYYGATTWELSASYHPEAYAARVKMSQIALDGFASDENQWLWITSASGPATLTAVSPFSNYAEMEPPEVTFFAFLIEKLGSEDEAHALYKKFSKGKVKSDYTIWRHVEELSWAAEE